MAPGPASVPPSPRQTPAPSSTSRIPRRRTSSSLGDFSAAETQPRPVRSSSPDKPSAANPVPSHSLKSSRTSFLPALDDPALPRAPASLIERRNLSSAHDSVPNSNARPDVKRTPSLSIYIPEAAAPSSSMATTTTHSHRPAPPLEVALRPPRRMGHSRTASRESALSVYASPASASTPTRDDRTVTKSPQRLWRSSQQPSSATAGRRCSAPVFPTSAGSPNSASPFTRLPPPSHTPYPFASSPVTAPAAGRTPRRGAHALERTLSDSTMATYTSFDLQHPKTPDEERDVHHHHHHHHLLEKARATSFGTWGLGWLLRGPWAQVSDGESGRKDSTSPARLGNDRTKSSTPHGEPGDLVVDERTALLGPAAATASLRHGADDIESQQLVGLAAAGARDQTRWAYVWGEVKCYAKHMLPPIFVFVVLVLVVGLLAYRQGIHRIAHPPKG
ncbi:hypothetical protein JCM3774_002795 [Rhodotorula dairenensis]